MFIINNPRIFWLKIRHLLRKTLKVAHALRDFLRHFSLLISQRVIIYLFSTLMCDKTLFQKFMC